MQLWQRSSIVVIGFVESLLFSGCLFGWPSLLHVLKKEGVYSHLCVGSGDDVDTRTTLPVDLPLEGTWTTILFRKVETTASDLDGKEPEGIHNSDKYTNSTSPSEEEGHNQKPDHCKTQIVAMTGIYTVASVSYGLTSILIGFSLDILGLWFTRIGGCLMTSGGFLFLAFTTKDRSWFLWPALNLIALGTSQLRLSTFQFANLWPQHRTTILIAYSSAYSISTTLFLLIQMAYLGGISYKAIGFTLVAISLLTFPPTLIMPKMRIEDHKDEAVDPSTVRKGSAMPTGNDDKQRSGDKDSDEEDNRPRILKRTGEENRLMNPFDEGCEERKKAPALAINAVPLGTSLWTLSAALHILWHFINFFLVLFYSASLPLWINKMTEDSNVEAHYYEINGLCALIAPIFIPIAGLVSDGQIRKASQLEDREEKLALTMQAPALTKAIASLFVLGTMICKVFFTKEAVYMSMVLIAISRPFIVGSCASYIRLRFHPTHFNRLNGIFTTIVSIMCLVQYPIIVWMKQSTNDFVMAQLLLIGILVVSFVSPGHIMIKPLARKYARAQLKFRTDV